MNNLILELCSSRTVFGILIGIIFILIVIAGIITSLLSKLLLGDRREKPIETWRRLRDQADQFSEKDWRNFELYLRNNGWILTEGYEGSKKRVYRREGAMFTIEELNSTEEDTE